MLDVSQTILSQYANKHRICAIIEAFNQAIDPSAVIDDWYENVWNPLTATGWGLDCWGRIVGVGRVLQVTSAGYIGFNEASSNQTSTVIKQFGTGIFYNGQATTSNYALTDEAYRRLIFAKAAANITDGSITSLNAILMNLFGAEGKCYVADNRDMTMTYVFEFQPTPVDLAIVYRSGVLPRPSGVQFGYTFIPAAILDNDFGGDIS